MPNSVRYYDSTMTGAPSLDNVEGSLITLLDACLVTGWTPITLDSLIIASDVATASYSTGHGLAMVGNTGPVVRIADATLPALNGDWRVTVTSGTTFTFATSGIADQDALGTITARRAPAGFEKAFSGTNKAAYRSLDITGSRLYCRIDDGYTTYSRIRGYEAMADVDTEAVTGVGLFPTEAQISGGSYVYKATGTNRPWALYTDGRIIYFFCDTANNAGWGGGFVFGDVDSYVAVDSFGCLLIASAGSGSTQQLYNLSAIAGSYLARTHTQLGTSITSARYSHGKTSALGTGAQTYPAPADNRLHLWPVECWDSTTLARGMMPGFWNPIHNSDVTHGLIIDDIPNLPGRTLKVQTTGSTTYECAMDITGPWRVS